MARLGDIAKACKSKNAGPFELTIDIDKLIVETDTDGSGFIDYEEFKAMFS